MTRPPRGRALDVRLPVGGGLGAITAGFGIGLAAGHPNRATLLCPEIPECQRVSQFLDAVPPLLQCRGRPSASLLVDQTVLPLNEMHDGRQPRNRAVTDIVAARDLAHGIAGVAALRSPIRASILPDPCGHAAKRSVSSCSRSARSCASASAASRSRWRRAVPQPASGAAPPSVSPPQPTLAARPRDTQRRNAQQTRHHPRPTEIPSSLPAAARNPEKSQQLSRLQAPRAGATVEPPENRSQDRSIVQR